MTKVTPEVLAAPLPTVFTLTRPATAERIYGDVFHVIATHEFHSHVSGEIETNYLFSYKDGRVAYENPLELTIRGQFFTAAAYRARKESIVKLPPKNTAYFGVTDENGNPIQNYSMKNGVPEVVLDEYTRGVFESTGYDSILNAVEFENAINRLLAELNETHWNEDWLADGAEQALKHFNRILEQLTRLPNISKRSIPAE